MPLTAAPISVIQRKFAFDLQTDTGTRATLNASTAVTPCYDPQIVPNIEQEEAPQYDSFSKPPMEQGAASADVSFRTRLYGSGVLETLPYWARLLYACGFDDSAVAGVFKPVTGATAVASFGRFQPGRAMYARDCMGTFTINATRARPAGIDWSFQGIWERPAGDSLGAITYDTIIPPQVLAATFSIGGTSLRVPEVIIEIGNEVEMREDITGKNTANDPTGYHSAGIVDRNTRIRIAPEALSLATRDWFAAHRTRGLLAFELAWGSQYNRIKINCPKLQLINPPTEEENAKKVMDSLEFMPVRDGAGDDDIIFDFNEPA